MALQSAQRKLGRAAWHMRQLHEQARDFIGTYVHALPVQTRSNGLEEVWAIRVAQDPPEDIALIIGDCLFNLRAALDHLAYELALPSIGDAPKGTEFPIFNDEGAFLRTQRGGGLYKIRGLDPRRREAIKELQPYHPRDGQDGRLEALREGLWMLHDLNVRDKHRTLHVVLQGASNLRHKIRPGPPSAPPCITFNLGPFIGGTDTEVLTIRWPSHEMKNEVQPSVALDVAISGPQVHLPASEQLWLFDCAVREAFLRVGQLAVPLEPVPELPVISWNTGTEHPHPPGRGVLPVLP